MKIRNFLYLFLLINIVFCQRQVSPESKVFNKTKSAVCTVFGKSGHGSGFLYNEYGLIITNDHVLGDNPGKYLSVQFNDNEKYFAEVVSRDKYKDIAIIGVNPSVIKNIIPLNLAVKSDTMVYEGERVIAIGSPLNQSKILTSGIISKVETNVLIHDVNINPGNSGGPLINMNSDVIGINTFGDMTNRGPGIYGSVLITEANDLINSVKNPELDKLSIELLPVLPKKLFPRSTLENSVNKKYPQSVYTMKGRKFDLYIYTPPQMYALRKSKELKLSKKRDNKTGEVNRYDLFNDLQEWGGSTGNFKPVVKLVITPKVGQTTASAAGNIFMAVLAGASGTSGYYSETYEFKADVKDVSIKKGTEEIVPFTSSYQYTTLDFSNVGYYRSMKGEDMAQQAILEVPIDAFRPRNGGGFEPVVLNIINYQDNMSEQIVIPPNTIYKISSDFQEYTGDVLGTKLYKEPAQGCS